VTTENSDWATNCPEYKVTAVQVAKVMTVAPWQDQFDLFNRVQLGHLPLRPKDRR
jgi:formate dehydrogenase major subunit